MLSTEQQQIIEKFQRNELTEHLIYKKLALISRKKSNAVILNNIALDELRHAGIWAKYSNRKIKPNILKYRWFVTVSRLLGVTFAIKLMERGEENAQIAYSKIDHIPEASTIQSEENGHEKALIELIDEDHLKYIGSIVLGLNDALVELTGVLAGLTLALQNPQLIALTGGVTGIAAALSMAASEYLSTKSEEGEATEKHAARASLYTGIAYLGTVILLVAPFMLISNIFISLTITFLVAIGIIAGFNYYISVVKDVKFKRRFIEMLSICIGVGGFSFLIGYLFRMFLGIEL